MDTQALMNTGLQVGKDVCFGFGGDRPSDFTAADGSIDFHAELAQDSRGRANVEDGGADRGGGAVGAGDPGNPYGIFDFTRIKACGKRLVGWVRLAHHAIVPCLMKEPTISGFCWSIGRAMRGPMTF